MGLGGLRRRQAAGEMAGGPPEPPRGACCECGAPPPAGGPSCDDAFHALLAWEIERPELGVVHHLLVLCFHLQHPSRYSPEALAWGREALTEFVRRGMAPEDVRRRDRARLSSANRAWRVRGTPDSHGAYERPVRWTMRAHDVVAGGIDRYVENVRVWARSVLATLEEDRRPAAGRPGTPAPASRGEPGSAPSGATAARSRT